MPYPDKKTNPAFMPYDLPCGCVGEYGKGSKICTHPCHDSYRLFFGLPIPVR